MAEGLTHEPLTPQPSVKLFGGSWSKSLEWSFYLSKKIPPRLLCSAVACVAILEAEEKDPKIVLMKNKRGWEELGGHIEKDETAVDAVRRETLEEGGFTADKLRPFGFKLIIASHPAKHEQSEGHYPFPVSFQPYFLAVTSVVPEAPSGVEVYERRAFDLDALPEDISTIDIVRIGIQVYRNQVTIP